MSDLASLTPQAKRITVAGREFALLPIKMGQLAAFSAAVMPIAPFVLSGRIMEAATDHYAAMQAALAIAAKAEPEWLDDLSPEDFLELVAAVVEVNGDFFARRLTPIILVMQARIQAAVDRIGAQSSPTLAETGMPSRLS
jgi:hypothetical protein